MNYQVKVSDDAFRYLRIQKGSLDAFSDRRGDWHERYEKDLRDTFDAIAPFLPSGDPDGWLQLLDVGSGLGGIDVLIRRHYEQIGAPVALHLLDGLLDPPVMNLHRETFNDMTVAKRFQVDNGLEPERFRPWSPDVKTFGDGRFDLVVSFGSWCFHYPPANYLRQVYRALAPGAVVILDVRTNKPDWMRVLETAFKLVTMVTLSKKWSRCVFRAVEAGE